MLDRAFQQFPMSKNLFSPSALGDAAETSEPSGLLFFSLFFISIIHQIKTFVKGVQNRSGSGLNFCGCQATCSSGSGGEGGLKVAASGGCGGGGCQIVG